MLKIQCRCGHKIAVPTEYGGHRIKCPKCQGAITVPMPKHAPAGATAGRAPAGFGPRVAPSPPAAEPDPIREVARNARAVRHARERQQKSHQTTVAMIAGLMVVLGLGLLLIIGMSNRPEQPVGPVEPAKKRASSGGGEETMASSLKPIRSGTREVASSGDAGGDSGFTSGNDNDTPVATTSTFDAAAGVTTIVSRPSQVSINGKIMTLVVTAMHDGKDLRQATQLSAKLRIKGDFAGLVSGVSTDDPVLTIEIDGREYDFKPANRVGGEDRKGENSADVLPNEIEYVLDRSPLIALAKGSSVETRLGATGFAFTPEQVALFKSFVPGATPTETRPGVVGEQEMEEKEGKKEEPAGDEEPKAGGSEE